MSEMQPQVGLPPAMMGTVPGGVQRGQPPTDWARVAADAIARRDELPDYARLRTGVVQSYDATARTATVFIGGSDLAAPGIAYLGLEDLAADDQVALAQTRGQYVVLGRIGAQRGMPAKKFASASASTSLGAAGTVSISGLSVAIPITSPGQVLYVRTTLNIEPSASTIFTTPLLVDSTSYFAQTFNVAGGGRTTVGNEWAVTGLGVGSHTVTARVTWGAGGTINIRPGSTITVERWAE